jgi:hypothetical protein
MLFLSTPAGVEGYVRGSPNTQYPWLQPPPDEPRTTPEKIRAVEKELQMIRHGPQPPAS